MIEAEGRNKKHKLLLGCRAIHVIMHQTFIAEEMVISSALCSKVFYHLNIYLKHECIRKCIRLQDMYILFSWVPDHLLVAESFTSSPHLG